MRTSLILPLIVALCIAPGVRAQYALEEAFPNLPSFARPIEMQFIPDGSNRFIVVEQRGRVWVVDYDANVSTRRMFLDLSKLVAQNDNEVGLLGAAFDPNFQQNHYIYFSYDTGTSAQYYSLIVRYTVSTSTPDSIIPSSATTILTFTQPPTFPNHKGGCLRFGPDGYLYASFGDGGSGGDPYKNGQNTTNFMGKILRLDVEHPSGGNNYGIPPTNPFANDNTGKKKEIFAYGLRNTWRFSFDDESGALWAADVGQDLYEEIDLIFVGENYGWNRMEGLHCYPPSVTDCDTTGLTMPIFEYPHTSGNVSITGGYVHRGRKIVPLDGVYVYGDAGSGRIWGLTYNGSVVTSNVILVDKATPTYSIPAFALDTDNEILPIKWTNNGSVGRIMRLVSVGSGVANKDYSDLSVTVTPNPFSSETLINATSACPIESMSLTDVFGRTLRLEPSSQVTFRSHDFGLSSGVYVLSVSNGKRTVTQHVVITR
ncbi:MAG: PQQ-dependent sugar dehydrogenase [Bacteroidetes bacterium]|nr:PQQ-dependent sugar dehydrogenase [Bacteroidota bacterium]